MSRNPKYWKEDGTRTEEYRDTLIHQTRLWMAGIPTHNKFSNECCIDFSCCVKGMFTTDVEERKRIGTKELMRLADAQRRES